MQLRSNTCLSSIAMAALLHSTPVTPALAAPTQSNPTANQIAYVSVTSNPDLQAARQIATTFFEARDYRDSMLMYQSICQQPSATADDFRLLGESHFRQKAYARAAQCFSRAIQMDSKTDALRVRLVQTLMAANDRTRAQQACSSALACVSDAYSRGQLETLQKLLSQPELRSLLSGSSSGRTFATRGPQG